MDRRKEGKEVILKRTTLADTLLLKKLLPTHRLENKAKLGTHQVTR